MWFAAECLFQAAGLSATKGRLHCFAPKAFLRNTGLPNRGGKFTSTGKRIASPIEFHVTREDEPATSSNSNSLTHLLPCDSAKTGAIPCLIAWSRERCRPKSCMSLRRPFQSQSCPQHLRKKPNPCVGLLCERVLCAALWVSFVHIDSHWRSKLESGTVDTSK